MLVTWQCGEDRGVDGNSGRHCAQSRGLVLIVLQVDGMNLESSSRWTEDDIETQLSCVEHQVTIVALMRHRVAAVRRSFLDLLWIFFPSFHIL